MLIVAEKFKDENGRNAENIKGCYLANTINTDLRFWGKRAILLLNKSYEFEGKTIAFLHMLTAAQRSLNYSDMHIVGHLPISSKDARSAESDCYDGKPGWPAMMMKEYDLY